MRALRLWPDDLSIDFVRGRYGAFVLSAALLVATALALSVSGLNYGIDFTGGLLIEATYREPVDIGRLRAQLAAEGFGGVQLQAFGGPSQVLIRLGVDATAAAGGDAVAERVRGALGQGWSFRRVEMVGPSVSAELLRGGIVASVLAVLAIGIYVWVRFEWQFGLAALLATAHDVVVTVGMLAVTGLEFNLAAIAALLTLAGYSINDTIVVFDRVRENLRRHKRLPLAALVNLSVNETLSRTVATSGTTLLAVLPLLIYGGPALLNFSAAIFFGIVVGTFSSVYVAASLLLYMPALKKRSPAETETASAPVR